MTGQTADAAAAEAIRSRLSEICKTLPEAIVEGDRHLRFPSDTATEPSTPERLALEI